MGHKIVIMLYRLTYEPIFHRFTSMFEYIKHINYYCRHVPFFLLQERESLFVQRTNKVPIHPTKGLFNVKLNFVYILHIVVLFCLANQKSERAEPTLRKYWSDRYKRVCLLFSNIFWGRK